MDTVLYDAGVRIERQTTAARINAVLNDPGVRPWVADAAEGKLDITAAVENPNNYCLMAEHGGCMFFRLMPTIYEVHTQVLPEGRGPWAIAMIRAAIHSMFARTDAWEIMTRVPRTHIAAKAATLRVGARFEFTRDDPCLFRGELVNLADQEQFLEWMDDHAQEHRLLRQAFNLS